MRRLNASARPDAAFCLGWRRKIAPMRAARSAATASPRPCVGNRRCGHSMRYRERWFADQAPPCPIGLICPIRPIRRVRGQTTAQTTAAVGRNRTYGTNRTYNPMQALGRTCRATACYACLALASCRSFFLAYFFFVRKKEVSAVSSPGGAHTALCRFSCFTSFLAKRSKTPAAADRKGR